MAKHNRKKIILLSGTGVGETALAAFDQALLAFGAGNFNLIRLSSVIPPDSQLIESEKKLADDYGTWGDKLYIVYADAYAEQSGEEAWAGIGWVVLEENGAGLFVEHHGKTEAECRALLEVTLADLCKSRGYRLQDYNHGFEVTGTTCDGQPACVVVAAVYEAKGWSV